METLLVMRRAGDILYPKGKCKFEVILVIGKEGTTAGKSLISSFLAEILDGIRGRKEQVYG
jgi:hypothetical protein